MSLNHPFAMVRLGFGEASILVLLRVRNRSHSYINYHCKLSANRMEAVTYLVPHNQSHGPLGIFLICMIIVQYSAYILFSLG